MSEINEQIKEIAQLLKTQDCQCTSDPIYLVQQKIREYGQDSDYCDQWEWCDSGNDWLPIDDEKLIETLDLLVENGDKLPEEYTDYIQLYYRDRWEYVTLFFTEKHAKEWIEGAKHRYKEGCLRVYVDCAYRNNQLKTVRKFLESQI